MSHRTIYQNITETTYGTPSSSATGTGGGWKSRQESVWEPWFVPKGHERRGNRHFPREVEGPGTSNEGGLPAARQTPAVNGDQDRRRPARRLRAAGRTRGTPAGNYGPRATVAQQAHPRREAANPR